MDVSDLPLTLLDGLLLFLTLLLILLSALLFLLCIELIVRIMAKYNKNLHGILSYQTVKLRFFKHCSTYIARSAAYLRLHEYQRALDDCDWAIALQPRSAIAYHNRALAYLGLQQPEKAWQDAEEMIRLNPALKQAYAIRGRASFLLHDYIRALSDFDEAFQRRPKDHTVLSLRAMCYHRLKDDHQAIRDMTQAIALCPNLASYHFHRGLSYHQLRDEERALQDFDRALALNPQEEVFFQSRAFTHFLLKHYEPALQDFQRVSSSPFRQESYFICVGYCWLQLKEYHQALQAFDQALALNPNQDNCYYYRWRCHLRLQNYQQALREINQAIARDPEKALYYHARGYVSLHLGKLKDARTDFLLAQISDLSSLGSAWMVEWCNLIESPDQQTAQRLHALTARGSQESTGASICHGVAFWLEKRFEDALSTLEQALAGNPENEDAFFWLGMVSASLGRDQQAKDLLSRALALQLPLILLGTLSLLEHECPVFFQQYALPLLLEHGINGTFMRAKETEQMPEHAEEFTRSSEEEAQALAEVEADLAMLRRGEVPRKGLFDTIHHFGEECFLDALPEIKKYIISTDERLRYIALHVLTQHYQLPDYASVAINMMKSDPDEECRLMAISGLLSLRRGTADPSALKALASKVCDENESQSVRERAYRAMRGIISYDMDEQLRLSVEPFDLSQDVDWSLVERYLSV